jgi:hypothetical protein
MLKKTDGGYDVVDVSTLLENRDPALCLLFTELAPFKASHLVSTHSSGRKKLDKQKWTNLTIYQEAEHVERFYQTEHIAAAQTVANALIEDTSGKPILIIDLGCGTGDLFAEFNYGFQGKPSKIHECRNYCFV